MRKLESVKVRCGDCMLLTYYEDLEEGRCHQCRMEREIESTEQFYGEER